MMQKKHCILFIYMYLCLKPQRFKLCKKKSTSKFLCLIITKGAKENTRKFGSVCEWISFYMCSYYP